ncbi:MAG: OmpA family protein [Raineya sp.]|jgi:outer membrane protein OmpA-like peptidoglycan-associated protein|nr:OmpA family protein [Raineya sp.]
MGQPKSIHLEYVHTVFKLSHDETKPLITDERIRQKALEISITDEEWDALIAEFNDFFARGQTHLKHNNPTDALEEFEHALSLNPHESETLYFCAECHYQLWKQNKSKQHKNKAIEFAEKSLEKNPKHNKAASIISQIQEAEKNKPKKDYSGLIKSVIWIAVLSTASFLAYQHRDELMAKLLPKKNTSKEINKADINDNWENIDPYKGEEFILKEVNFDLGSLQLNHTAKEQLNHLVTFLNKYPDVSGVLEGHTDDIGDANQNLQLSTTRAKIAYDYLISKGISSTRIKYVGFGSSKPFVPNTSDLNRAKNRRIDFKITEIKK